jgi:hypothetical protein
MIRFQAVFDFNVQVGTSRLGSVLVIEISKVTTNPNRLG